MIPAVDNAYATEGPALLTSMFAKQPVIKGIVTSLMNKIQFVENSYWALIDAVQLSNHPMAGGPWDVLDKLGSIVGGAAAQRNGLADADYLAVIKLQARANRARGLAEDVLSFGSLMINGGHPLYLEVYPAAFYLAVQNVALAYPLFVGFITQVRAAATYGVLIYTTWAPGNDDKWASRYDATAGQGSWGSRYDATAGGKLSAATVL